MVTVASFSLALTSHAMGLDEYLDLVQKENLAFLGSKKKEESAILIKSEAGLLTTPTFFAEAKKSFDTTLGTPPMSSFTKYENQSIGLGISNQFEFGLQTKFSYQGVKNAYEGSTFNPDQYWDFSPHVELSLPLWANGFGSTIRAQKKLTTAQNETEALAELANQKSILVEAEILYWQLSSAKERLKIQEEALLSAKKIQSYVQGQKNKNLGESADVLQANALVDAYALQLQQSNNEKLRLERAFNKLINRDTSLEVTALDKISYNDLENYNVPQNRPGEKLDVLIRKSQTSITEASSALVRERNKPRLDLISGYSLQGRSDEAGRALQNSKSTKYDSGYVGLMFSVPLDFSATKDARAGAERLNEASKLQLNHALSNQELEWSDLKEKMQEAKVSLKLSRALEDAQKIKLENERIRLRQGRATTYQVLLFEQDYSQAQAGRVLAATELIALKAQLKLYHGEK